MIQKKIEKLIPYVDESFITYPLWEEGIYLPQVNIWSIKTLSDLENIVKLNKKQQINKYDIHIYDFEGRRKIYHISINPIYDYEKYEPKYKDWSIEDMIEIAINIVK